MQPLELLLRQVLLEEGLKNLVLRLRKLKAMEESVTS